MNAIGVIFLLGFVVTFSDAYAIRCFIFNCDDSGSEHTKASSVNPSIETQHFAEHDQPKSSPQTLDEFHHDRSTRGAFHVEEGSDRTTLQFVDFHQSDQPTTDDVLLDKQNLGKTTPQSPGNAFHQEERSTPAPSVEGFHHHKSTPQPSFAFHGEGRFTTEGLFFEKNHHDKSTPRFDKDRSTPTNIVKDFDHTKDTTQGPYTREFNRKHFTTENS